MPLQKKQTTGAQDSDKQLSGGVSRQFDLDSKLESNDNLLLPAKPFIRGGIKAKGKNEILHIFKD